MRYVMTRVFPDPAPARISSGPSRCSTASRCSGFRFCRKSIGGSHSIAEVGRSGRRMTDGRLFERSFGMSKNINVNPDHYKVRGRERQGEDILHEQSKAARSQRVHALREQQKREKKSNRGTPK